MDENPYAPSEVLGTAADQPAEPEIDLRGVASAQRVVLICAWIVAVTILFCIVIVFLLGSMPFWSARVMVGPFLAGASMVLLVTWCVGAIATTIVTIRLKSSWVGWLVAILALVPMYGYLFVWLVSLRASKRLKQSGYAVGLFGASLDQWPDSRSGS